MPPSRSIHGVNEIIFISNTKLKGGAYSNHAWGRVFQPAELILES